MVDKSNLNPDLEGILIVQRSIKLFDLDFGF